jgi:hypothetical protein
MRNGGQPLIIVAHSYGNNMMQHFYQYTVDQVFFFFKKKVSPPKRLATDMRGFISWMLLLVGQD